jgi:hypothetical protein
MSAVQAGGDGAAYLAFAGCIELSCEVVVHSREAMWFAGTVMNTNIGASEQNHLETEG